MNKNEKQSVAKESQFKGKPVLALERGEKFALRFGVAKAKLILAHVEDIRAFTAKHAKKEVAAA